MTFSFPRILERIVLAMVLVLAAFGYASVVVAQELPPRPDGPVYDGADILSEATESELDLRLRDYNKRTGHAIIVATVPSLDGENIEPYATRIFSTWGIGGEQRDTGLLLLVARDDRKMRIEVGYGLHPYFGGIMAGRVIRDTITPRFKEGNFDAGVTDGVDAILGHLAKSPEDAIAIAEAQEAAEAQRERSEGGIPLGMLVWLGFIFFLFILPLLRGKKRSRKYRGKGRGPWGKRNGKGRDGEDDDDDDNDGWGRTARDIILWEVGSAIVRGAMSGGSSGGGWSGGGGGGGFGGFGGGMSGGGGASGGW